MSIIISGSASMQANQTHQLLVPVTVAARIATVVNFVEAVGRAVDWTRL